MEINPDFDAGEVARTVALAVSNLHTRSQSSDSGNDETPLVKNKSRPEMNINTERDPDKNYLVSNEGWKLARYFRNIPKRYILTVLGFLGFCNVYALRVNLSVALVAMVNHTASANPNVTKVYECSVSSNDSSQSLPKDGEFIWSSNVQANILGSFFYGYLVTQIPGGRMAELFGGKWLFGIGVLCTAVLTLLTPAAARLGYGALIVLRILEGLGEGVTFPAMHSMLGSWLPKMERSLLSTIIYSGAQIGTVISMPISGILCDSDFLGGWPSVFYVFGTLGCIWFLFWAMIIHETPDKHPTITTAELMLIQSGKNEECQKEKLPIPWRSILTSIPVWTLMITHFGQNWGFYTFLTELPNYLSSVLLFSLRNNGFLSALPYLLQAIFSWTISYAADVARQRQYFTISTIRKICNTIAFFGPALCLFGVMIAACDHYWSVAFLTLAMGFNGGSYSGFMVTHVDMAPDFAGTLMGMTNAFATLAGVLAPLAVGALTEDSQSLANWRIVFLISALVYFLTGILFVVFGSAKLQKWGVSQAKKHPDKDSDLDEK